MCANKYGWWYTKVQPRIIGQLASSRFSCCQTCIFCIPGRLKMPGYKCFRHQGTALLYQVTEEDVEVPNSSNFSHDVIYIYIFLGFTLGSFLNRSAWNRVSDSHKRLQGFFQALIFSSCSLAVDNLTRSVCRLSVCLEQTKFVLHEIIG